MMTGTSFVYGERLFLREWTIYVLRVNAVRMKVLVLDCIMEQGLILDCIVKQGLILVWVFSTMDNCSSAHFLVCSLFCYYS
jgi:hypothetical protein